jgi:predicted nucleotidyltransferase
MKSEQSELLSEALCGAWKALENDRIDALLVGGIALSYHLTGEPQLDHDVDLFVREGDVERAMDALAGAGFEVVRTHPTWLFKARLEGATVDVLHVLGRVLGLDDEMLSRAILVDVGACRVKVISREDLAVGQAGAARAKVPDLWYQAVDLLRGGNVDWDYLVRRGASAPDRFASLLHFARSEGIEVRALD